MATKKWISTSSTDWATAGNWSPSGVPTNSDDVYFDATGTASVTTGLDQSTITLTSLTIAANYTGQIGTSSAYLQISATTVNIGVPSLSSVQATGSTRIKLDTGTNAATVTVQSTASTSADTGLEPVRIIGAHASNALYVTSGRVGLGTTSPGEAATFPVVGITSGATVTSGTGCTLATATNNGGTLTIQSAITTLNALGGTTTTKGTGLIGTLSALGGTIYIGHRRSGTDITTLNWGGAVLNFQASPDSLTVGTTAITRGGTAKVFSASQINWGTVTFDATNTTAVSMSV